jgi:DNA-directed RNA polymerase subunit N (RpoN/RPB10)
MVLGSYIRCPTCGQVLADKQSQYEDGLKRIMNDPMITDKEKERGKLLDKLNIKDLCCRLRMLGFVNFYDIIL